MRICDGQKVHIYELVDRPKQTVSSLRRMTHHPVCKLKSVCAK